MSPYSDFGQQTYDADNENRLSVDVDDADDYFHPDKRLNGKKWRAMGKTEKTAALVEAQDMLELGQGRIMATPDETDQLGPRDDYAVFEMAFYLLDEIYPKPGKGSSPKPARVSKKGKMSSDSDDLRGILIPPKVQRYLGRNRLKMVRG